MNQSLPRVTPAPEPAAHSADRSVRTALLDATLDALLAVDADGRLLHFNRRAEAMFGLDPTRDSGAQLTHRLVAPDSHAGFDALLAAAAETGTAAARDLDGLAGDGTTFPVEFLLTRFEDGDGAWFAVCGRDMSLERRAQTQLRQRARVATLSAEVGLALTQPGPFLAALHACMRAVVDHLDARAAGVWLLDDNDDGGVDPQTPVVLTLAASADPDGYLASRYAQVEVGLSSAIGRIAADGEPYAANIDADESPPAGIVAVAGHPLLVGDSLFGVVAMYSRRIPTDVDDDSLRAIARKLALGTARQRGVDALRLRAAELARAARALERSNRDLDQFAYIASHDLKAPLRGIANLASWIEDDMGESVPDSVREHLVLLRGRVERMDRLIDGILHYSRAGRVQVVGEPVSTSELVRDVAGLLSPPDGARFEIASDLPTITAPKLLLQQVFQNLIGNALKYARRTDPVVRVSAERAPNGIRFSVSDNGPGIAPAYHSRIWGVFQRLEARDKVEGTGIGLALVKKIVESVGGTVGLDSDVGRGATFHFTWPAHQDARRET